MAEPNKELMFPKDEIKATVKWQKGYDFMDGTPRYTFEGRDPSTTYERFQVVIYVSRMKESDAIPGPKRKFYFGYVTDNKLEYSDTIGPFRKLSEAKIKTLELFNHYIAKFSNYNTNDDAT